MGGAFDGLNVQDVQRTVDAFAVWRKIMLSIRSSTNPNEGANLAAHSRIVDLKNGVLLVEADHPGWIELLQLRKNYILRGLSMYARNMGVQTLAFRLAGKRGNVTGKPFSAEEARGLAESRVRREEEVLARAAGGRSSPGGASVSEGQAAPPAPELEAALSALRRDMGA
ncbi:MAG: DUF721 domain-containing protein [Treponema sp.]|nr:DUF721 domain-containing protein [Treponema sp.]